MLVAEQNYAEVHCTSVTIGHGVLEAATSIMDHFLSRQPL